MAVTQTKGEQILDGDVSRVDLNTSTSGKAVIRKVVGSTNVALSSTGADAGTGDVTLTVNQLDITSNVIKQTNLNPTINLKQTTSNAEWALRLGKNTGLSNAGFNLIDVLNNQIVFEVTQGGGGSDQPKFLIGDITGIDINPTSLGVFNTNPNIGTTVDIRGKTGAFIDNTIIELEGADYDSTGRSLFLGYQGSTYIGTYATMGLPAADCAIIRMQGENNLIYTLYAKPLVFGINNVEVARFSAGGNLLIKTTTDNTVDEVQVNGSILATQIKKSGGTSSQYLMADGSVSTGSGGGITLGKVEMLRLGAIF